MIHTVKDDDDADDDDEDDAHGVDSEDPFSEPIIVWEKKSLSIYLYFDNLVINLQMIFGWIQKMASCKQF